MSATDTAGVDRAKLAMAVEHADGTLTDVVVTVQQAYNFGYAGREQAEVLGHVEQMRALGMPAPSRVPAIFPIPPDRVSTATSLIAAGDQTYGEVEFALIKTAELGWVVTIASDHTDLEVEQVKMPKAKGICPDIVGSRAWLLSDVEPAWDACVLRLWGTTDGEEPMLLQEGHTSHLLSPDAIIAELTQRRGGNAELPNGTVILSGTVAGEPNPSPTVWRAELADPTSGRTLAHSYTVERLPEEL